MDSAELEAHLGKTDDTPEIAQLLSKLGYTKKLKIARDDDEARVELLKQGLILIFEPESAKSSKLKLTAIQIYSDLEEGFKNFTGALPNGILLTDSQKEVQKKMGKPTKSKKEFRLDHWIVDGRRISVQYNKAGSPKGATAFGQISNLEIGFPMK